MLILDRTLEAAQEQQLARSSQLGEALAGVAHELKNPLAVIRGYADLGLDAPTPDEATEYFTEIGQSAERMNRLIGELLGMSRPTIAATTSIHQLLGRIVAQQRIAWGQRIRIEEEIMYEGDVAASADRLEQIISNLLSNAVDAVDGRRGVITVRCGAVDGQVAITVADNGGGIPPEVMPRLFEPLIRSKPEGAGTGLGLAIARRLAIGMDGDLSGRNHDKGGAEFTLTLPVAGEAITARTSAASRHTGRSREPTGALSG